MTLINQDMAKRISLGLSIVVLSLVVKGITFHGWGLYAGNVVLHQMFLILFLREVHTAKIKMAHMEKMVFITILYVTLTLQLLVQMWIHWQLFQAG